MTGVDHLVVHTDREVRDAEAQHAEAEHVEEESVDPVLAAVEDARDAGRLVEECASAQKEPVIDC